MVAAFPRCNGCTAPATLYCRGCDWAVGSGPDHAECQRQHRLGLSGHICSRPVLPYAVGQEDRMLSESDAEAAERRVFPALEVAMEAGALAESVRSST